MNPVRCILFEPGGYTFLCAGCYAAFSHLDVSGLFDLRGEALADLFRHVLAGGGCQWCDTAINLTGDRRIEGVRLIEALGPNGRWIECQLEWCGDVARPTCVAGYVADTVPLRITVKRGCRRRVLRFLEKRWPGRRIEVRAEASLKGAASV